MMIQGPIANGLSPQLLQKIKLMLLTVEGHGLITWLDREVIAVQSRLLQSKTWEEFLDYRGQHKAIEKLRQVLYDIAHGKPEDAV